MTTSVPITNLPFLYAVNCQVAVASDDTVTIQAGQLRDSTNTYDITVPAQITVDARVTGYNGLDTGDAVANTWYAVYVIYDSVTGQTGGLLSTSATAPYLPAKNGYTFTAFRLVGWVLTDGTADFLVGQILGNGNARTQVWDEGIRVLNGGASTTAASVDCSLAVAPLNNTSVLLDVSFTPNAAGNYVAVRPYGSTATQTARLSGVVAAVAQLAQLSTTTVLNSGAPTFLYLNSAATGASTMYVRSFDYFI